MEQTAKKPRYALLDTLRGLMLCSMAAYHTCWDLTFFLGANWPWYTGTPGFVWQQSICWTFIFLSGFCFVLGRRGWQRGAVVFAAGALVTVVTLLFSYESRVVFGVLTFLGSAMLLAAALDKPLAKLPPAAGFWGSAALFAVFRNINAGTLGVLFWPVVRLPGWLYQGLAATYLGFQAPAFYSSDYFSLLPWLFLFLAGYFACRWLLSCTAGQLPPVFCRSCPPLAFLGRHSLLLYLLHQPLLYAAILLVVRLRG